MPTSRTAGLSEDQISAVAEGNFMTPVWSEKERALLQFLDAVITGPGVSDEVFSRTKTYYSDQALVEVVVIQVRDFLSSFECAIYILSGLQQD